MTKFLTVYPDGWFGRTPRAKQHAFAFDGECDKYGRPVREDGRPLGLTRAFCGVEGGASGNPFTGRLGGSAITCARCSARVSEERTLAHDLEHGGRGT